MAQRVIVCIDGEYFNPEGKFRYGHGGSSNAYRVHSCVEKGEISIGENRIRQETKYFPGIDWDGPIKLEKRALQVLEYCQKFGSDDELWLFGSGIGALIARVVIHLLSRPELKPQKKSRFKVGESLFDKLWQSVNLPHGTPRVRFLGLFDAIKDKRLPGSFTSQKGTRICHAVSIHETMQKLQIDILHSTLNHGNYDYLEAWFAGAHVDVVGGATHDGLSLYSLQWMLVEARTCGLALVKNDGVESQGIGNRTMQLVLPAAAASRHWAFRYVNGITIIMYDIRSSHGEHNLQESGPAPHVSRKLQPWRLNSNEEEMPTSNIFVHNIVMNKTELFEPKLRGKTTPRTLFSERKEVSDVELLGFCENTHQGMIIHPSVYFLCEVYHKRLETESWQNALIQNLHDFRLRFLEQDHERPYRPWLPSHAAQQNEPCRILICGGTGVGKSTLLNKVFGTELTQVENMRAGIHDVNKPLESDRHPGLIIHDSRGFEAGSDRELTLLLEFLRQRLGHADSKERLDAIWLCIEASTPRPIQTAHEVFLKHLKALDSPVPLILVYTKMDLFDGSKKVLKSRERFLEDYVSKLLPSSRFELVTTCSEKIDTAKELVRVTLRRVGEHHPEAKPAMIAGIKFNIEEKITFAIAGVIDLLLYDKFASWRILMEVPLANAAATPILVRFLCERISQSFGLSKITPKDVSNVLNKLLLQNITRFLAHNAWRDLADVVAGSATLFGYKKSLIEIIPAALLTLRCAIDLIICLDGAISFHTCDVSLAELSNIQMRYDNETIQNGAGTEHTRRRLVYSDIKRTFKMTQREFRKMEEKKMMKKMKTIIDRHRFRASPVLTPETANSDSIPDRSDSEYFDQPLSEAAMSALGYLAQTVDHVTSDDSTSNPDERSVTFHESDTDQDCFESDCFDGY